MKMKNLRKYGDPPYNTALIHGGPGAPGELAPLARGLSLHEGILEPLQTQSSIKAQVEELRSILEANGNIPITLIGHSWGAWLSYIFAASHPSHVKKLILVGSGPFEESYALNIMNTRIYRLNKEEQQTLKSLIKLLSDPAVNDKSSLFKTFGMLMLKSDSFNPFPYNDEIIEFQYEIYERVWKEANDLRRKGKLLELGKKIQCPVIAIHGDHDPHPHEGVNKPLSRVINDFRFVLLKDCGHSPWLEKLACKEFYKILKAELD